MSASLPEIPTETFSETLPIYYLSHNQCSCLVWLIRSAGLLCFQKNSPYFLNFSQLNFSQPLHRLNIPSLSPKSSQVTLPVLPIHTAPQTSPSCMSLTWYPSLVWPPLTVPENICKIWSGVSVAISQPIRSFYTMSKLHPDISTSLSQA